MPMHDFIELASIVLPVLVCGILSFIREPKSF